jgi:curved DNA-binding protein CbpA
MLLSVQSSRRAHAWLPSKIVVVIVITLIFCQSLVLAQDAGEEFVNEILEEERRHYGHRDDPFLRDEDVEQEKQRQAKIQGDLMASQNERIRQEREALYEKELARMNQEQQKKAKAQKKKDTAIVNAVLDAYQRGDLYGVLGLHFIDFRIPSREIKLASYSLTIPGFDFFHISDKTIKKAYRTRSRLVHPDRNRDGRAEEAFIALEDCASILSDERERARYNEQVKAARLRRREGLSKAVRQGTSTFVKTGRHVIGGCRRVLGPFAFPVTILGCLII